jgi:hypothetical protein
MAIQKENDMLEDILESMVESPNQNSVELINLIKDVIDLDNFRQYFIKIASYSQHYFIINGWFTEIFYYKNRIYYFKLFKLDSPRCIDLFNIWILNKIPPF